MPKHPLDEEFDVHDSDVINDFDDDIVIPEVRDLDLVIDFALTNYKELLENCKLMDAKSQLKARELARDFLREAKDAMDKKEKIKIARERLKKGGQKGSTGSSEVEEGESNGEGQGGGVSRAEVAKRAAAKLKAVE